MPKIQPFLWFDDQAEEAANLYVSIFKNSKIGKTTRYGEGAMGPKGQVMTIEFEIDGQPVTALLDGGEESQCGWLKDRFGFSWQIVPKALPRLLADPDPAKAQRVLAAMMKMRKLDVAALEAAAAAG